MVQPDLAELERVAALAASLKGVLVMKELKLAAMFDQIAPGEMVEALFAAAAVGDAAVAWSAAVAAAFQADVAVDADEMVENEGEPYFSWRLEAFLSDDLDMAEMTAWDFVLENAGIAAGLVASCEDSVPYSSHDGGPCLDEASYHADYLEHPFLSEPRSHTCPDAFLGLACCQQILEEGLACHPFAAVVQGDQDRAPFAGSIAGARSRVDPAYQALDLKEAAAIPALQARLGNLNRA